MESEGSYRVYNSPKPIPIPNRINPVHATNPLPKDPF